MTSKQIRLAYSYWVGLTVLLWYVPCNCYYLAVGLTLKLLQDIQLQLHIKYTETIQPGGPKAPSQNKNNNLYLSYITDRGKQS